MELGYVDTAGQFPLVFSTKTYNSHYSESYGGWPGSPNPGAGPLTRGTNHNFQVWRNPNGNDATHVELKRDGLFFGYYSHDRLNSAAVLGGAESFSKCDDMLTHM